LDSVLTVLYDSAADQLVANARRRLAINGYGLGTLRNQRHGHREMVDKIKAIAGAAIELGAGSKNAAYSDIGRSLNSDYAGGDARDVKDGGQAGDDLATGQAAASHAARDDGCTKQAARSTGTRNHCCANDRSGNHTGDHPQHS
jgi:hypothetical protein